MKAPKRSIRRHKTQIIKKKVEKFVKNVYHLDPVKHQPMVNHMINNRTLCSCWMCGNPRKYFNHKTIQEERYEDDGNTDEADS